MTENDFVFVVKFRLAWDGSVDEEIFDGIMDAMMEKAEAGVIEDPDLGGSLTQGMLEGEFRMRPTRMDAERLNRQAQVGYKVVRDILTAIGYEAQPSKSTSADLSFHAPMRGLHRGRHLWSQNVSVLPAFVADDALRSRNNYPDH